LDLVITYRIALIVILQVRPGGNFAAPIVPENRPVAILNHVEATLRRFKYSIPRCCKEITRPSLSYICNENDYMGSVEGKQGFFQGISSILLSAYLLNTD
jgi:hypothetical protein